MKAPSERNMKAADGQRKPAVADHGTTTSPPTVEAVNLNVKISTGVGLRVHTVDPETKDVFEVDVIELEVERRQPDLFAVSMAYFSTSADTVDRLAGDHDQDITLYLSEVALRALPEFFSRLLEVVDRAGILSDDYDGRQFTDDHQAVALESWRPYDDAN